MWKQFFKFETTLKILEDWAIEYGMSWSPLKTQHLVMKYKILDFLVRLFSRFSVITADLLYISGTLVGTSNTKCSVLQYILFQKLAILCGGKH